MATQAPISKATPLLAKPKGRKAKPFRSIIDRTPDIQVGDAITSPMSGTPTKGETTIAAGKFKATCLQLLDAAAAGESITITKHGKAVARLVPPDAAAQKPPVSLYGLFKGKVQILGDIVSPDFEAWGMEDPRKAKKKKK